MKLSLVIASLVSATVFMLPNPASSQQSLNIKGSDTMVNLSAAWAEAFMKVHKDVSVSVTGGGSGTGIAAFLNGTCDLANCSRSMSQKEIDQAHRLHVEPVANTVALDGLAIVVHSSNPIKFLTMEQVGEIYTGKITNWSQVGGKPGKIVLLSRESSSGTYAFMREHVMGNKPYAAWAQLMPSTKAIQTELSSNPNAIGYGGEAYFLGKKTCKVLLVKRNALETGTYPSAVNVRSKRYPISRPLLVYSRGTPTGLAADFLNFCKSKQGQRIVELIGYVSLSPSH